MTAPAPAMSEADIDRIEARWDAYIAGNATARSDMAAMIREVRRLRSARVVVPVPRSVYVSAKPSGDYEVVMNYSQAQKAAYAARDAINAALKKDPAP